MVNCFFCHRIQHGPWVLELFLVPPKILVYVWGFRVYHWVTDGTQKPRQATEVETTAVDITDGLGQRTCPVKDYTWRVGWNPSRGK